MLTIRSAQVGAFQPTADNLFARRIAEHLREKYPAQMFCTPFCVSTISKVEDTPFQELILAGLARARRYGLTQEASISGFVVLMFLVAPNFDAVPNIAKVLEDADIPPDERVAKLCEVTSDEDWQTARENYDSGIWPAIESRETDE